MTTKRRVKDLADEFGVSNKDIMQQLREIGVQAKSHMTTIEPEEVEQLREVMASQEAQPEVVERVVQPGVIVRRRRKGPRAGKAAETTEEAADTAEDAAEEAAEAVEEAAEEQAQDAEQEAPAQEEAEEAAEEAVADAEPEAKKKAKKAKKKAEEPKARIIKPAVEPEPEPEPEPEAEVQEAAEAEVPEAEAEAEMAAGAEEQAEEPAEETTEQAAAPEAEAKAEPEAKAEQGEQPPADEGKAKKTKKAKKKAEPQVRIISMPDPNAPPPVRTPSRPAPAPRRGRPAPAAGGAPGQTPPPGPPPAPGSDAGRKKRKKDRRVVEFTHTAEERRGGRRRTEPGPEEFRGRPKRRKRKGGESEAPDLQAQTTQPVKAGKRKIKFDEAIRVQDMAKQMGVKAQDLIKTLFGLGVMATINQSLDMDTATVVANEFGYEVENVTFDEQEFLLPAETDKPEDLKPRPPVVTIMGHVDHGKTSLLDAIRETKTPITAGEAGGITQHIGAYHVKTDRGDIVFLDTPGHEAFTTMRMRGAQVTDIVILVVAADDGVMDQTREAISHSKAAGVPIVVAVNKIDKEGSNPDNVKRQLAELDLAPEDWGGETIYAHVSAKQRTGLDELLEMVLLQAEVLELKANPDKPGRGHIVEAKLDKGKGPVGTLLISEGTVHQGDYFVCGTVNGRVRAMFSDQGKKIKEAGPAMPVEIQGFDSIPEAGDEFVILEDEKMAKRIAGTRQAKQRDKELAGKSKVSLESFLASRPEDEAQVLNLVVKADVQGSLEAVSEALNKLSTDEVRINLVHGGTGAITEGDILLASASEAIIVGFNVRPGVKIKEIAEEQSVEIRFYDIIYKLVNEIKDAMSGMLAPDIEEVYLGQAEVRDTFSVPKVGTVAGCAVVDGKLTRNAKVRLVRDGVVVYTGALSSLKRFKDDAKEVAKGFECGVGLERFNDVKVGDMIEAFEEKEVARTIDGK